MQKPISLQRFRDAKTSEPITDDLVKSQLAEAQKRITPLWDVRDYVAVNPLFGYRDQHFLSAVKTVRTLTGVSLLPEANFFKEKFEAGEIPVEDLTTALILFQKEVGASSSIKLDPETLLDFIKKAPKLDNDVFVRCVSDVYDKQSEKSTTEAITKEVSKWASAYYDEGQAHWKMPTKGKRFYSAWKELSVYDSSFDSEAVSLKELIADLPGDPETAIIQMTRSLVSRVGAENIDLESYFARLLATVQGWASFAQRFEFERSIGVEVKNHERGKIIDILAVRMAYDLSLLHKVNDASLFHEEASQHKELMNEMEMRYVWLLGYELSSRKQIADTIDEPQTKIENRPIAQAAFCIDVRSEVIRRHLENQSSGIQTIGFAGFFGLPVAIQQLGYDGADSQCPVLIKPAVRVKEQAVKNAAKLVERRTQAALNHYGRKDMQSSTNSSFSVAETFGFGYAVSMAYRNWAKVRPNIDFKRLGWGKKTHKHVHLHDEAIDLETRVTMAAGALTNMGLTKNFAKFVFFFGHGGEAANNPFESALDCGACAGHNGNSNSQLLARLLNSAEVRAELKKKDIVIPDDTVFVSGWHNTTRDSLVVDGFEGLLKKYPQDLSDLRAKFDQASDDCRQERAERLPNANELGQRALKKEVQTRSADWSEVRPEWGLARNHSFIVGRRQLTRQKNLDGRSFLHDYDEATDPQLSRLELIMTAPMIVTNWINMQYYASTIDPEKFGAGNKAINNVVGTIGCIQGNQSDLLVGLSEQSVRYKGKYFHEPMRLQVFIEAKMASIDTIIEKHQMVADLVNNGWLHIVSIDPKTGLMRYKNQSAWVAVKDNLLN